MTKKTKLLSHALAVILAVACLQCIALSAFAQDIKLNVKTKENANVDVSGSKITVTDTSFNDDVWNSKALVDTGVTLEPGKQYTVSYTLSGKEGVGEFFLCKGESLDARYSDSFTTGAGSHVITFTAASPKLFLGMQVGNVGADNSVTADIASINEVAFTDGFTVLKSNNCEVSIEGGKLTVTDTSDNNDVWDSVVLFDAGVKLQVGQPYALDYLVSGEHGVGEVFMCKSLDLGNRYDTTFANDTGSKHRYFVAQTERVLIGMQFGNIGKGNSVTIEGVNAVYTPVPIPTLVDMAEFEDKVVIRATDNSYDNDIWTSKVRYKLADNLEVGKEYEVSFNVIGDDGIGEVFLSDENNSDKRYKKSDDGFDIFVKEAGLYTMHFKATGPEAYLVMQMGNIGKGSSVIVEASRPTVYTGSKDAQVGLKWMDKAVAKLTTASNSTKVAGTTITATDTNGENDNEVWDSKAMTFLGNILEKGKTYVAKLFLSSTSYIENPEPGQNNHMGEVVLKDANGNDYGGAYAAGSNMVVFKVPEAQAGVEDTAAPLYALVQCGNVGEGEEFTAEITDLFETTYLPQDAGFNYAVDVQKNNTLVLTDTYSDSAPGKEWSDNRDNSKAIIDTGAKLEANKKYRVSFNIAGTTVEGDKGSVSKMGEVFLIKENLNNNDTSFSNENKIVAVWDGGAEGNVWAGGNDWVGGDPVEKVFTFTAKENSSVYLAAMFGDLGAGNTMTISNFNVEELVDSEFESIIDTANADVEYKDVETGEIEMPVITGAVEEALSEQSPAEEPPVNVD